MKTTSIFPVPGPASLILMSKYARSHNSQYKTVWYYFYQVRKQVVYWQLILNQPIYS